MLTSEIGDRVAWGGNVVGVGCGLEASVPDTSVLLPATTFTDDCQSWYPFIFSKMAWLPSGISTRVRGVSPLYALSRYMLAPDGLDLTVISPVVSGVEPGVTGTMIA